MSSHYKEEVEVKKYKDYTEGDLSICLEDVEYKKVTQEQAAAEYGVSQRTICYELKVKHDLKPGKLYFFSKLGGCLCQMYHSIESFWISYW